MTKSLNAEEVVSCESCKKKSKVKSCKNIQQAIFMRALGLLFVRSGLPK